MSLPHTGCHRLWDFLSSSSGTANVKFGATEAECGTSFILRLIRYGLGHPPGGPLPIPNHLDYPHLSLKGINKCQIGSSLLVVGLQADWDSAYAACGHGLQTVISRSEARLLISAPTARYCFKSAVGIYRDELRTTISYKGRKVFFLE